MFNGLLGECEGGGSKRCVLMGINGLFGSEGGGALQSGDRGLRQHGGERLAALDADAVVVETAATESKAC